MKSFPYKNIYFLGIGGIGMSALARFFKSENLSVLGYDKTETELTAELQKEGIQIHFKDDPKYVVSLNLIPDETLVIRTPAVPSDHKELAWFRSEKFQIRKRAEILGMITKDKFNIAVAGTHGKTTTSSMIAHLLHSSGINCTAFLGGISKNIGSNLLLASAANSETVFVVEADEYDRSFLQLSPDIALITSMDPDHLDIYGDAESMIHSYHEFAGKVKKEGKLVLRSGLAIPNAITYSASDSTADYHASNIRIVDHKYVFDIVNPVETIYGISSGMPGMHNVENAVGAAAAGHCIGIDSGDIKAAIASFTGVKRRFDLQFSNSSFTYIDDYAHHPEELRACISSIKELYPGEKVIGIFQPHLYSRTRDFASGFSQSLSLLDELILLDIYPAREEPIPGITSELILKNVSCKNARILSKEEALTELFKLRSGVLLTLGAGDIDTLVSPLKSF